MIAIADPSVPGGIRLPGPRGAALETPPPTPAAELQRNEPWVPHVSGWMDRIYGPYDQHGMRRVLLLCDLFCGAGGFTTGAMRALRELGLAAVMAAVNHWPVAIATHRLNHPRVRHYIEDVKAANPVDIVPERYLDVLLCSPSCVFFSRARGGKPSSDQKRMDPEAIIRWIDALDVRILICENVPEFTKWCRIDPRTGRPKKGYEGEYFRRWIRKIKRRGYTVEWRILTCADYGDPTSRQRWFMIARKDGQPIEWPAQTHSKSGLDASGRAIATWRGAAEIIEWQDRGTSIFNRRPRRKGYRAPKGSAKQLRALAYNTLRRVKAGTDRFTGPWKEVFAAAIEEEMDLVRMDEAGLDRPAQRALLTFRWSPRSGATRVDPGDAKVVFEPGELIHPPDECTAIVPAQPFDPYLVMMYGSNTVRTIGRPAPTITAAGNHVALTRASISARHRFHYTCANRSQNAPRPLAEPVAPALTGTGGGLWLATADVHPYVLSQQSCGAPRATTSPVPSVATAGAIALSVPSLTAHASSLALSRYLVFVNHGDDRTGNNARRVRDLSEPLQCQTTTRGIAVLDPVVQTGGIEGYTAAFFGSNVGRKSAATPLTHPLRAVTTKSRYGFCLPRITPYLVPQFGERAGQRPRFHCISDPPPAVTSHGAGALVVPVLVRFDNGSARGGFTRSIGEPLWTHTGKTGCGLAESYIISPRHSRPGGGPVPRHVGLPVPTLTGGGSQVGVVSASAREHQLALLGADDPAQPPLLTIDGHRRSPPESIRPGAGRIVWVDGLLIQIDIAFRMLRNRELARSHSFDDAESTYEFVGTEAEQTKQVGNSVPVMTAKALILSQIRNIPGVLPIEPARATRRRARAKPVPILAAA